MHMRNRVSYKDTKEMVASGGPGTLMGKLYSSVTGK